MREIFFVLPGFSPCERGEKEEQKMRFCLNDGKLSKSPQPELLDQSILYCLVKLALFECEHPSVNKPMVKTEPTVPSTRL